MARGPMQTPGNEHWRDDLAARVDQLVAERPTAISTDDSLWAHVRRADVHELDDVTFALNQLLRILDVSEGTDTADLTFTATFNLTRASYEATADPINVRDLARFLQRKGKIDLAVEVLEFARGMAVPSRALDIIRLLIQVGELYRLAGSPSNAEEAFTSALAVLDDHPGIYDDERAIALNNLGLVYSERGDLGQAKQYLIGSLEIYDRAARDPLSTAVTLDNLGNIESRMARDAGRLDIGGGHINGVVEDHLRNAEEHLNRARGLFEEAMPGSANDYVTSMLISADVAEQRGDRDLRAQLSEQAIELARTNRLSTTVLWETARLRGEVLLDQGDAITAVKLLTTWFQRLGPMLEPQESVSIGLATLLRAASAVGDQVLTDDVAGRIAQNDTWVLPRRLLGSSEAETRKAFKRFNDRVGLIVGHCLPAGRTGVAPAWLYELVLNTKGVLAEWLGSGWLQANRVDGVGADLLAQVRVLRTEVARMDLEGPAGGWIRDARRRHEAARRKLRAAEAELQLELAPLLEFAPLLTIDDLQAEISADTVLLDVVPIEARDGSFRHVLFRVQRTGPILFMDLGKRAEIDDRLEAMMKSAAVRPNPKEADPPRADRWSEFAPALFDATDTLPERIVVAPTGLWGMAPLGLLPDPNGKPLVEHHVVTLVPSARSVVMAAPDTIAGGLAGPPMVIGDPDFDLGMPPQLPFEMSIRITRLRYAATEATAVATSLGVDPVIGETATRQRLLETRRPRILHIAAHATFLRSIASFEEQSEPRAWVERMVAGAIVTEEQDVSWFAKPMELEPDDPGAAHRKRRQWLGTIGPVGQLSRSVLVLAGVNAWLAGFETAADVGIGMVSAGEFAMLDLSATELVVLSACETGVGAVDVADGGLLGLRSAALAAGARSCVSTLWSVDDLAAAVLVTAFYDRLKAGDDLGTALRAAQLGLRETHPDPYFWAGWVVEGVNRMVNVSVAP